jgi:hypothetical protein
VWPIEWFGNTYLPNQFTSEDLRPRFNPWALLQKAYCKFGYKLNTPFLDDPKWRKTWMYLSDKNFGGNANIDLDQYKFKATVVPQNFVYNDLNDSDTQLFYQEDCVYLDLPFTIQTDPTGQLQTIA